MVTEKETLDRLNSEKDYEDKLAYDLDWYFIDSLPEIKDISENDKLLIKKILRTITYDSLKHSFLFTQLIEHVINNGENNY